MIVNDPPSYDLAHPDTMAVSEPSEGSHAPSIMAASMAASTGIVVLSVSLRILYINQRAVTLVTQLARRHDSIPIHASGLPAPLVQVSLHLCSLLSATERSGQKPTLVSELWADHSSLQVTVEGLALPGPEGVRDPRIVLLLRHPGSASAIRHLGTKEK